MFKDDYQKSMSFPVSKELLERTAQSMEAQKKKAPQPVSFRRGGRIFYSKLATAAAALFLLAVGLTGSGVFFQNGVSSGQESAAANDLQSYSLNGDMAGGDTGGTMRAKEAAPEENQEDGTLEAEDDACPRFYSASPAALSVPTDGTLTGVEEELPFLARSAEEAGNSGNPWNGEGSLEALPIYWNPAASGTETMTGDELYESARAVTEALGRDPDIQVEVRDGTEQLALYCTLGAVKVTNTGWADVVFEPGEAVAQAANIEAAASSFYEEYAPMFHLEQPATSISSSYTGEGVQTWTAVFYENSGVAQEGILSFNLHQASFTITFVGEDGYQLDEIHFRVSETEKSMGEYPMLSVEEARELLLSGEYQTGAPLTGPLEESEVQGVELLYWTEPSTEFWQPVYRFLVLLSTDQETGLNEYAACYVPACAAS